MIWITGEWTTLTYKGKQAWEELNKKQMNTKITELNWVQPDWFDNVRLSKGAGFYKAVSARTAGNIPESKAKIHDLSCGLTTMADEGNSL